MSTVAKQYLQEIEKRIPCSRQQKKQFLEQFENEVLLYCEEHGVVDVTVLESQFGTPEELAEEFLPEVNVHTVSRFVRSKHRVLFFLVAVLTAVVVAVSGMEIYSRYKQNQILNGEYIEKITYEEDISSYITSPTYCEYNFS